MKKEIGSVGENAEALCYESLTLKRQDGHLLIATFVVAFATVFLSHFISFFHFSITDRYVVNTKNTIMKKKSGLVDDNADELHYKVFTVKRQGLNRDPKMPIVPDKLKWVVNTATLIYGKKDAVLIDCFLTIEQSNFLIESISASGKNLKYIYITHGHGDHFFGLQMLLDKFTKAKAISTSAIVKDAPETVTPEKLENYWNKLFPAQIPDRITFPQVMDGNTFSLEGHTIQVIETGFTDTHNSTSVYVPSIGLLVAGDVVYNGIHPFLAETTKQSRQEWIAALRKLESLHPNAAVAGHKNPENTDSPDNIGATKKYLEDFEQLNKETSNGKELFDKMFALYPERANPGSLWGAATKAKSFDSHDEGK